MTTLPGVEATVEPCGVAASHGRSVDVLHVMAMVLIFVTGIGDVLTAPWYPFSDAVAAPSVSRGESVKYTAPVLFAWPAMPTMTSRAPSPVTSYTWAEVIVPALRS